MTITRIHEAHFEADDTEIFQLGTNELVRDLVKAKTGTYSLKYVANSSPAGIGFQAYSGLRTGFFLNHVGINGDVEIVGFHETLTANYPVMLVWMEDELRWDLVINGSIEDSASTATIGWDVDNQWFHVGIMADNNIGFASVYLDGVQVLNYSGAITGADWDMVYYGKRQQAQGFDVAAYYDDIYVDAISGEGSAALPQYQYLPSYTNAAGSSTGWTPLSGSNYQMVDDGAIPDWDNTYNKVTTSAGTLEDTHETDDIVLPADFSIVSVIPWANARKLNAADDAQLKLSIFDGATTERSGALTVPVGYRYLRSRHTTQPDGNIWTEADFNNMEFGYQAAGSF